MDERAACSCGILDRLIAKPNSPLLFDALTGEFQLRLGPTGGETIVPMYYCFSCGGATPESRREQLFAEVTHEETRRLTALTRGLTSVEQVVERLGPPDHDLETGSTEHVPARRTTPPQTRVFRSLRYHALSDTADVHFEVRGPNDVRMYLIGKYIGPTTDTAP